MQHTRYLCNNNCQTCNILDIYAIIIGKYATLFPVLLQLAIVAHEIGHAMGFYHEQSRSDRDTYLQIFLNKVRPGREHNFALMPTKNFCLPYDYSSVMHYGETVSVKLLN